MNLPRVPSDCRKVKPSRRAGAYRALVKRGWRDSLAARIEAEVPLAPADIYALVALLGARCQPQTRRAIRDSLERVPHVRSFGIYGRVIHTDTGWHYCAGQSYPDEIRTVRNLLTRG